MENPRETKNIKPIYEEVIKRIEKVKFGQVVVTIHNGKVVEIEKKEKNRFR
ncbi:MAG: YezD family protein [Candidatus Omnitrophota bacterium]|nr:YezD family protein [Candidatus Omnitrophota bacterium]